MIKNLWKKRLNLFIKNNDKWYGVLLNDKINGVIGNEFLYMYFSDLIINKNFGNKY